MQRRVEEVIGRFDELVEEYDARVPFRRNGQYESHRRTIDLRRELGRASVALADPVFTRDLYETLQRWGIGRRRSILLPIEQFRDRLLACEGDVEALDGLRVEDGSLDIAGVSGSIDELVSKLGIVDNKSLIVAGTKALHHLLPDLVPPMDRRWTGAFFGWWPIDPQQRQTAILTSAYRSFANIASAVKPSRLVGGGWRTSSSKILDNAVVAYCIAKGLRPRGS